MALQSVEQQRVKSALAWAENGVSSEALSAAVAMPSMILTNGLGQTAAFYNSKGGAQAGLYQLLSDWLKQEGKPYSGKNLLEAITHGEAKDYRAAQVEALAYLQWVKKFAKAYSKGD